MDPKWIVVYFDIDKTFSIINRQETTENGTFVSKSETCCEVIFNKKAFEGKIMASFKKKKDATDYINAQGKPPYFETCMHLVRKQFA